MALEEDLLTRIAGVATTLGGPVTRVSWFELPRETWKRAVLLTPVFPGDEWTHEGVNGLARPRVQIDVYGDVREAVTALARAVKAELQRTDPVTVGSTKFLPPRHAQPDPVRCR